MVAANPNAAAATSLTTASDTNSLVTTLTNANSSGGLIAVTKETKTNQTANIISATSTQSSYMKSIIPATYVSYLESAGIDTTDLDLNTVDLNSDLGKKLIALKQAYEIATGTAPKDNPAPTTTSSSVISTDPTAGTDPTASKNSSAVAGSSSSNGSSSSVPGSYLATGYSGQDLSVAALETSLIDSSLMADYFSKNAGSAYDITAFKAASMGNLGTFIFNLNAITQTMGCAGGGTACGASGSLESQIVTLNYTSKNISNSYRISYGFGSQTSGSALSSSISGSGSSTFVNLTGTGKAITLPVDSSHTMLKMLGTFAPPNGSSQYANFRTAIELSNPATPNTNITIATPNPYTIIGVKQ